MCECDKSCGLGEYLDCKNCVCRNSIVDRLVAESTNAIDENKSCNATLNTTISSNDCDSCTLYVLLFVLYLTKIVIIGGFFIYFYYWRLKKEDNVNRVRFNPNTTD